MKRLVLLAVLAAASLYGFAKARPAHSTPLVDSVITLTIAAGGCVNVANCILPTTKKDDAVWVSNPNFVDVLDETNGGAFIVNCSDITTYSYQTGVKDSLGHTPFLLHAECAFDGKTVTVDETGYSYYKPSGGGRAGGGAGTRYAVSGGVATIR